MPCTTILVGKNASYDGSTLMARNEDSGAGNFMPKKYVVVQPQNQPRHYKSVISGVEIDLDEEPMRYTAMPNAVPQEGIWGEAGINEANVAMSETETLTSNPRVLGADPLVKGGIGEEDMLTLVLPYIHSAREGVERLGRLLCTYGTYEMNGIGFQDKDEIWWLESVGGHHWVAKRVPDDAYMVGPNQQGIDVFDFADAYGDKKEHLCDEGFAAFIVENRLDLMWHEQPLLEMHDFDLRSAIGSHSDSDHSYNTPRAWYMLRYFNPTTFVWDGPNADFLPEANDLPWCMVPEKKITIEDIKYILSSCYQGTPYDPYARHEDERQQGKYRPIGINRNNFVKITQLRPYVPAAICGVEWIAEGSNRFNAAIPFYANVKDTPSYLRDTGKLPTTESFYWANRMIGALADAHFAKTIADVERYQLRMASAGQNLLKSGDKEYLEKQPEDVCAFLQEINEKTAELTRNLTYELLDNVLKTASNGMKNSFSRSDA